HLVAQIKIVSLAIFVILVLTAWVLRSNLKTLDQLSVAAYRFEQGDHGVRVEAGGATETRSAARAFNSMAEKVEQLMQQITWQAGHDALTGLPNRSLLADRMEQAISNSQRQGKLLVVGLIDLDGFKEVNDLYGHELGDKLLKEVAQRFLRGVRGGDTVARMGGDEFVLLLANIADMDEMAAALDRILLDVARPYQIDDQQVRISASIGVTVYPLNKADPESLLRHADQAMYQAKQAGRDRYFLFDVTLDQQMRSRLMERERVAEALRQGEMRLYYQPKVNMRTGQIIGFEALLRWQHPERGVVGPLEFLPQVEHTDLIVEIGLWVLQEALRQLAEWDSAGMRTTVSVNLAARHFQNADLVDQLRDLFERYPTVSPGSLELEILESAALEDIQSVRAI
ncbi:MAG: diguanylate cyclase, partial [Gallionellaceae bacterium]|nr:diguanylate cyclase [Gallionellaceae bacterium]